MKLSPESSKQLEELCKAPPMPTLALVKLMRRRKDKYIKK